MCLLGHWLERKSKLYTTRAYMLTVGSALSDSILDKNVDISDSLSSPK